MIQILIKNSLDRFFSAKLIICFFVFSFNILYLRMNAGKDGLNYWEFVIYSMTDHYYILYFMIIFYLFSLFGLFNDNQDLVLFRSRSFIKFFLSRMFAIVVVSIIFVLLHLLISFIVGTGLEMNNQFSDLYEMHQNTILNRFSEYFPSPVIALILVVVHMIIGLSFFGILFLFMKHFLDNRYVVSILIVMYFLMLLSLRSDLDVEIPYIFINNYIILHHSIESLNQSFYYIVIVEFFSLFIIFFVMKKAWFYSESFSLNSIFAFKSVYLNQWYNRMLLTKKNIAISMVLLFLMLIFIKMQYNYTSFMDMLFFQFYGHPIGSLYLKDFVSLIIYNGVPLFLFGYFLEQESKDRSSVFVIRIKYRKRWLNSIVHSVILFNFFYIVLTLSLCFIISLIFGMNFDYYIIDDIYKIREIDQVHLNYLLLIVVFGKFFELVLNSLILFLLFCYTKNAVLGFVVFLVLNVCVILGPSFMKYLPIGSSSLSRMSEITGDQGITFPVILSILITSTLLMYLILYITIQKKMFD